MDGLCIVIVINFIIIIVFDNHGCPVRDSNGSDFGRILDFL